MTETTAPANTFYRVQARRADGGRWEALSRGTRHEDRAYAALRDLAETTWNGMILRVAGTDGTVSNTRPGMRQDTRR